MTYVQAIAALLDENWSTSISDRATDVPKPKIVEQANVSKSDLKTEDVARVVDGGNTEFTPLGFGWTHERIEPDVTIELRSVDRRLDGTKVDGRHRVFGKRETTAEPDRYIGLVGETKRILDANRKGFAEFDLVVHSQDRDRSDLEGTNYYRADIDVELMRQADHIDPST